MATEYETIKLREGCSAWDPIQASKMNAAHVMDRCAHGKPVRRIVRDGSTVTVTHVESGRSVEFPWGNVRHAVPVAAKVEKAK